MDDAALSPKSVGGRQRQLATYLMNKPQERWCQYND